MKQKSIKIVLAVACSSILVIGFVKGKELLEQGSHEPINQTLLHCNNGLEVNVKNNSRVEIYIFTGLKHVKGEIVVSNKTNEIKRFSTRNIKASLNGKNAKIAYIQYFSSEVSDGFDGMGDISIQPGQTVKAPIYWATDIKRGVEIVSFNANCETPNKSLKVAP